FRYRLAQPALLEVAVFDRETGLPLPGFGLSDHVVALAPDRTVAGARGDLTLTLPTGGNDDVVALVLDAATNVPLAIDTVVNVAVGDVFLAGGQSNMS